MDAVAVVGSTPAQNMITRACQLTVFGCISSLAVFWLKKFAPSENWKTSKHKSVNGVISTMLSDALSHFLYACLFFIGIKSLTSISQTIAVETPAVKFSFFHRFSIRFLLPEISFGDYLAIDITIFLCKGIFSFVKTLYGRCFNYWAYAAFSALFALIFPSLLMVSLSVLNPVRISGILHADIMMFLLANLNVYFVWLLIPSIFIFNMLPLTGELNDPVKTFLYGLFVCALVYVPLNDILSAIIKAGGIAAISENSPLVFLLHAILYGLIYSFGYKTLFMLNSCINSYFDSEVAPFNPVADDFSGSIVTIFSGPFFKIKHP
ncbi:hypothetical protein DI09_208p20 [Mitosporidium daphniae]|uniref:Uncharacterized protein n=1 Tax=Mitosporidium daphniae TaxID=1485682 RepID=A0A098VTG4_9MICR|nr:uncharacterized protein DI09_208p20 [Mitosporidium daphniae]KGG52119.1 hypothetical protein DI09_208p20 [Mitosporidium daphniae]|eukprot:XP_013238555.1 uncharacterized protein DI09_208p20 [Mitosporidium daphniae]